MDEKREVPPSTIDLTLTLKAMHQAFERMNMSFEQMGSQLRQHEVAIESIQREKTSIECNGARHGETRYNGGNNRRGYKPMDEHKADNEFWEDDGKDRIGIE